MHRGKFLEIAVRNSGLPISEVARRLNISRQTMYKYFDKEKIDIELVNNIGKIIGEPNLMDEMLDEIKNPQPKIDRVGEPVEDYGDPWKVKYFKLQEKYNNVVQEMFEHLKNEHQELKAELQKLRETLTKKT